MTVHNSRASVENGEVNCIQPGNLVTVNTRVPLTVRPADREGPVNTMIVAMMPQDVGLVLACGNGSFGPELMVMTHGKFGWYMTSHFEVIS